MNIIIVEDDDAQRELLQTFLKHHSHHVKSTGAVLPAFEMIRRGNIDVILMDIGLPGLDGLAFVRKLKTYGDLADIPVIAMTGQTEKFYRDRALKAGCAGYLPKPIDTKELLKLLAEHDPGSEPGADAQSPPLPSKKKSTGG